MCTLVSIIMDGVLEDEEIFTIGISSSDLEVTANSEPSSITIIDTDGTHTHPKNIHKGWKLLSFWNT